MVVGVGGEGREDLHHACVEPPLILRKLVPRGYPVRPLGQVGAGRQDTHFFLTGDDLFAVPVPAHVEFAPVALDPLARHMVRCVTGSRAEVEEEGLVGVDISEVGDELDSPVGKVLGQVIALLMGGRWVDQVVVVGQVRFPLVRVAAEEAVETVETPAQRPAVARAAMFISSCGVRCHLPTA